MAAKKTAKTAPATKATKTGAKKTAKKAPAANTPSPSPLADAPSVDDIARAAYLNYRKRVENGLPGDSHWDWLQAEQQLRGQA